MPQLNEEQKIAAKNQANSLLVLAGPGTGKTSTLVGRYVHLVNEGYVPKDPLLRVLKKASTEIEKRLKEEKVQSSNVTTFHALGLKIVNDYGHLINVSAQRKYYHQCLNGFNNKEYKKRNAGQATRNT